MRAAGTGAFRVAFTAAASQKKTSSRRGNLVHIPSGPLRMLLLLLPPPLPLAAFKVCVAVKLIAQPARVRRLIVRRPQAERPVQLPDQRLHPLARADDKAGSTATTTTTSSSSCVCGAAAAAAASRARRPGEPAHCQGGCGNTGAHTAGVRFVSHQVRAFWACDRCRSAPD